MIKLFIVGIDGKMGRMLCGRCGELENYVVTGGFDRIPDMDFKVFTDIADINVDFDAVIDFSRPEALNSVIAVCERFKKPCVLATTGYTAADQKKIIALSKKVPVFQSGNMSLGIFVLRQLIEEAAAKLWNNFDIEIVEKHHNQKVDAPSGTAKMLEAAVQVGANGQARFTYGRNGADCKRKKGEVTVHAVRGGTVVGQHEVLFCGEDEMITVSHTAQSRKIFADGAIRAAAWLIGKPAGLYEMKDMVR